MKNYSKTKIDWPNLDYTWNPQVGCRRGCYYCVVRQRIWPRIRHLYGNNDYNIITFLPEQLDKPYKIKKPSTFFVCFYSDIAYSTTNNLQKIIDVCEDNRKHTFKFLTKDRNTYMSHKFPDNCRCGFTLTQCYVKISEIKVKRPFISAEPLLGRFDYPLPDNVEMVIVGAMTGKNAITPKPEWIQSIKDNIPAEKIYWKKNIRKYLK